MVYVIQNHPDVPAGIYGELLQTARIPFEIIRPDLGEVCPPPKSSTAVIVLGGYMGVHDEGDYPFLVELKKFIHDCVAGDVPFLGICLGGQLLAEILGGEVTAGQCGEKGTCQLFLTEAGQSDLLFDGVAREFSAFQWHNDSFALPPQAHLLASSCACPGQAFRYGRAWGVQFHPEADLGIVRKWSKGSQHAPQFLQEFIRSEIELRSFGARLLGNFLTIAGCG